MRKQRKSLRLTLSIQGRRNTINIGIDVIRLLGEPTHVCIEEIYIIPLWQCALVSQKM